jgi:phosphoribosylaminoimidazole (AIR) synthetase
MGIGMVLIVNTEAVSSVRQELTKFKLNNWVIGEVVSGYKEVEIV